VSNNLLFSLPQKLAYHGSMFRYARSSILLRDSCTLFAQPLLFARGDSYERPQRGRYREFQQFGA